MSAWDHKIEVWKMPPTSVDDKAGILLARGRLAQKLDQLSIGGWELAHYNCIENADGAHFYTIWKRPVP